MSISPIAGIGGLAGAGGLSGLAAYANVAGLGSAAAAPTSQAGAAAAVSPATFPDLAGAIDSLQAAQSRSDALAVRAVTGDLDDVHDYTIASTQAAVALELTVAVRNKAVEAFTEIMRMQA